MSMAKKLAIRSYIDRHGLKICWIAKSLDMSEELFRYHMRNGFKYGDVAERFNALMKAHSEAVMSDLPEIPVAVQPKEAPQRSKRQGASAAV